MATQKATKKVAKKAVKKTVPKTKKTAAKKAPTKKALVGKQANLPKELRDKILASPEKMLKPAAMKMMKKK